MEDFNLEIQEDPFYLAITKIDEMTKQIRVTQDKRNNIRKKFGKTLESLRLTNDIHDILDDVEDLTNDIYVTLGNQRKQIKFSAEEIEQKEVAYDMWRQLILALRDREDKSLGLEPPPIEMEDLEMHGQTGIDMDGSFNIDVSYLSEGEKIMYENWKKEEKLVEEELERIDDELAEINEGVGEIFETLKISNAAQMDVGQNMKALQEEIEAKKDAIREEAERKIETRAMRAKRILVAKLGPVQNMCLNSIFIVLFLWMVG